MALMARSSSIGRFDRSSAVPKWPSALHLAKAFNLDRQTYLIRGIHHFQVHIPYGACLKGSA